MPNWGEHLLVANRLLKKINTEENIFLFANVLPDVQDGYIVKDISNIISHQENHYYLNKHFSFKKSKHGYQNFYDKYKSKLDEPIILGYLTHLMTDYLWNNTFYTKKCISENNKPVGYINIKGELIKKTKNELREDKQEDFKIFNDYIYDRYKIKIPQYDEKLAAESNRIKTININNEDVKKVIKHINNVSKNHISKNKETKIFTIQEMNELIDETVEFICGFLG